MENDMETCNQQSSDDLYELGQWMGRKQAFSLSCGKTAAADVECLRNIRERKLYSAKGVIGPNFANSTPASPARMPTGLSGS